MSLKTAVVLPAKYNSTRLPKKNTFTINGEPLVRIMIKKLIKSNSFDTVFLDTDSSIIWDLVSDLDCTLLKRPETLANNSASANDLLLWEYNNGLKEYDLLFQSFCTSPLIKVESIATLVNFFKIKAKEKVFDSVLTVCPKYEYYWDNDTLPKYNLDSLPNSFELKPLLQETHAIYGITNEAFIRYNRRIGDNPHLFILTELESYDINTLEDFRIVRILGETICRSYL